MTSSTVKFQSVSMEVKPWRHPSGKDYFRAIYYDADGTRRAITRSTLAKAKADALRKAVELSKGTVDFDSLTPHQIRAIRRMLDADPQLALVDEFLVWHGKKKPVKNCREAVAEFIAAKKEAAGTSRHNVTTLARHLSCLPDCDLSEITVSTLPALTGSPRSRSNRRAAWVTFFLWCQEREYLPHGEKTAPERLEKPIVTRGIPSTWSPAELRILLAHVRPQYLPWLALAAFAGIRTEEISPEHGSAKSPLDWSDFKWDRGIIIIRPETSKTKQRRVIPINDAIRSWLPRVESGRVGPMVPPSKPSTNKALAETTRLGNLVGGWKRNALRHSFISYRAAQVGLAQTAMEAGNSESEAKKSYNDAKGKDEAAEWFAVLGNVPACSQKPGCVSKLNATDSL